MFCVYWELDNGESGRLNEPVAPDAPQICTVDLVRAGRVRMCHLSRLIGGGVCSANRKGIYIHVRDCSNIHRSYLASELCGK